MKSLLLSSIVAASLLSTSCSENKKTDMPEGQTINEELKKISALLQDTSFALELAKNQEAAYYASQGQPVPVFLTEKDDSATIARSFREEKIATNIAGFYALECGIGTIIEQKGGMFGEWLTRIVEEKLDSAEVLVLNRFANATWKAGQPFRSLKRITKDNFTSSVFLPTDEVKKDYDQILAATNKLLSALIELKDSSNAIQLQKLDQLLKDKQFALQMAMHMEGAYYTGQQQAIPPFLKPEEDASVIIKSVKEEKIATNVAGFYALECGLSYLATAQNRLPSEVLQLIINDSISNTDKRLFERFANATWKAGQPFRGLNRIERKTFTPFDLLPSEEIEKDWVQIKAAARMLLKNLEK
jgi:hypothetical protein